MRFRFASVHWLALLALAYLKVSGAQMPPPAALPVAALETLPSGLAQPFEQAWDVVELVGQPMLTDSQRPARVVLRPQGLLWVDGGCNYFSGRVERDAQGLFRVSKYGSTHRICEKSPRSEAFLNSALVMVDNFRWDRGLLLRSGSSELLRLQPSANQELPVLEQDLARYAVPAAAGALAPAASALEPAREGQIVMPSVRERQVASQDCRPAKVSKATSKSLKAKPPVCQPIPSKVVKSATGKAAPRPVRATSTKPAKPAKASVQTGKDRRAKAGPVAKGSIKKSTPVAQKRPKS